MQIWFYTCSGVMVPMTNFDFLLSDPQFTTFGEVAVAAEKIYAIDPAACVLNCRRSMEFAVKWMYSVDGGLVMPYDNRLVSLMDAEDFRDIVGAVSYTHLDVYKRQEETSVIQRYGVSFKKIRGFVAALIRVCNTAMEHGYGLAGIGD